MTFKKIICITCCILLVVYTPVYFKRIDDLLQSLLLARFYSFSRYDNELLASLPAYSGRTRLFRPRLHSLPMVPNGPAQPHTPPPLPPPSENDDASQDKASRMRSKRYSDSGASRQTDQDVVNPSSSGGTTQKADVIRGGRRRRNSEQTAATTPSGSGDTRFCFDFSSAHATAAVSGSQTAPVVQGHDNAHGHGHAHPVSSPTRHGGATSLFKMFSPPSAASHGVRRSSESDGSTPPVGGESSRVFIH